MNLTLKHANYMAIKAWKVLKKYNIRVGTDLDTVKYLSPWLVKVGKDAKRGSTYAFRLGIKYSIYRHILLKYGGKEYKEGIRFKHREKCNIACCELAIYIVGEANEYSKNLYRNNRNN